MNHQKLTTKLEGYRTRNSNNHYYINEGLYHMYMIETFISLPTIASNLMMVQKQ